MTKDPGLESKVQWLMDRTAISELLFSFARALDTRDYATYVDNYADGGVLELPDPVKPGATIVLRKEQMLEAVPKSLGRYRATHHLSANHQIRVDGDRASSVSYLQAVHVREVPTDHWSAGGRGRVRLPAHRTGLEVHARAAERGVDERYAGADPARDLSSAPR